jgi:hypothetical protein
MSNPVATFGFSIPTPSDPKVIRKTYQRIVFEEQSFFVYGEGEYDPTHVAWSPEGKGDRIFIFVPLGSVLTAAPDFVGYNPWSETVSKSASGFLTARYSVMPKIFVPSRTLVDNGINTPGQAYFAWADVLNYIEAFNWDINSFNGSGVSGSVINYGQIGAFFGSQYISLRAKNDSSSSNTLQLSLREPPVGGGLAPTGDWAGSLVAAGAFVLMLNVTPSRPGHVSPEAAQANQWFLKFTFGEVTMEMNAVGAMKVKIGQSAASEQNAMTVNLAEGKTKEGPPQQEHIDEKSPYVILVYPVWNGIIVQSGVQDSQSVIDSSSTYIPKLKAPSVLEMPYSAGFSPTAPADVEVGVGAGAESVVVDMGNMINVEARNVRLEMAYLPCYFSKEMLFEMWFIGVDDTADTAYLYNIYTIWTRNNTASTLDPPPVPVATPHVGSIAGTHYWCAPWKLSQDQHNRYGGEVLGAILELIEERQFPIRNSNGSFNLTWSGGVPGDGTPSGWVDYVQNISVTIGRDGSSGSFTVDRYGVAGQGARAVQSIGAITMSMAGGFGTVPGSIFQGLAMGVGQQAGSDGAAWTIPVVGLEQKLNDIALINVPFFDGYSVSDTMSFLGKYAGISVDFSNAPSASSDKLGVSEDINVPRFDWKSGTSVMSAMQDVMKDVNYAFVVRDGRIYVYELGSDGLPTHTGPDWEPQYPDTKLVSVDETPEFGEMRNDIVVIALQNVPGGQGTKISDVPTVPRFIRRQSSTTPSIPWAKSMVDVKPGSLSTAVINRVADNLEKLTKNYRIIGRTSIPGNANIRPYDRWGDMIIQSVTQNVDFTSKQWTTDLEFYKGS